MAITIVGYRGTGKTTVGALLAQRLGWDFVDTDPEVERRAGKSIASIFAEEGEPYFRTLESSVLGEQLDRGQVVVSTGGGAILRDANRETMRQAGPVVWLTADVDVIAERISLDPSSQSRRPSLSGTDPVSEIQEVLNRRLPLYDDAAGITVVTNHRTPASIVDEILVHLPESVIATG